MGNEVPPRGGHNNITCITCPYSNVHILGNNGVL